MGAYPLTIEVPGELAQRLRRRAAGAGEGSVAADLFRIIELGLREMEAQGQLQFDGAADVLEFLAGLPAPADVLALRPSPGLQARIDALLDKNRQEGLTAAEEQEWAQIEYLEHLVRLAKAHAWRKLNEQRPAR